jgi:GNAT superfamily N-acetyltransferase
MLIREMNFNDIKSINSLIKEVFDKYMSCDYTKEGIKNFYEFISPESLRERLSSGNRFYAAEKDEIIAGVIEVRDNSHIALFYVREIFHGMGIGRGLFEHAIKEIPPGTTITVNSSPFAAPVYEKLGFKHHLPAVMKDGMAFIPMKYIHNILN